MLPFASFLLDQAETSPHVHFLYDPAAGRVLFVNAAYELTFHGQRAHVNDELPGLLARLHPDDLSILHQLWQRWRNDALTDEVEIRLQTTGQPDQWFCLLPHHYQDADGHVLLGGMLRDVSTARRHRENSDEFNTKKNTVLGILAHDLAGFFALLQQLTQYIQEEMSEQVNTRVPEMLALMQTTSQRGVALVHDLIDQEFLASAAVELKRERVDLRERVRHCLETFQRAPGREARHVSFELPTEPVYAEVDANKLLQVVSNLVTNALKFTPDEGHVTVKVEPCAGYVRIAVVDEGIGIPAALQARLFERFTPARRLGLRGEPTTGLGLWLCKTIVELHKGRLTVTSNEGLGSTFTVELPDSTDQ
ncbi:ATP-binding protein [Hymenobacter negativus]|uniref:histidine kinase n=1 Tax=Hymenobacter negativus TaxID=2795026 RepID=A0ABS3QFF8_9BACT|nr:ATP-binding protein [Hymenobacter negativus]MBO2009994.1 hypothetical protein [Hymenobacter negativus]